jgi:hypothetical protein
MTMRKSVDHWGRKKTGGGLVARRTMRKPVTFFFTENGTDPTSLTLVGNEADHIQRQASASMESWPWVNFA